MLEDACRKVFTDYVCQTGCDDDNLLVCIAGIPRRYMVHSSRPEIDVLEITVAQLHHMSEDAVGYYTTTIYPKAVLFPEKIVGDIKSILEEVLDLV